MILAIFILYLAVLVGIGLYFSRYNRDIGDFVLGGRRLGPWVAAFSAQASDFSGWLLIGLPAAAYAGGLSLTWTCIGCTAGVMFNWLVLAPRLRRETERFDAITIPDFLEARFQDRTRIIRTIGVLTILVFYVTYVSAQFIAAGSVFQTVFHETTLPWSESEGFTYYHQGLLIGAVIILLYTTLGGFLAVCWTDFLQAIMMVTAAIVLPVIGIWKLGGLDGLWQAITAGPLGADMLAVGGGKIGASLVFGVVIYGLAWGLGYPGQPHIVSRFMAIQEPRKIPKSALIAMIWTVLALYGSMFIGLVAVGILGPQLSGPATNRVMPMLAVGLLPAVAAGLVLSAAVAAMMSTVDSQIIVATSAVVRDGYEKLFGRHPQQRTAVWLARVVVVIFGVLGVLIAWRQKGVFETVLDAWTGLAAGLGPAIVLGCLWARTSKVGVIVGMITGVSLTLLWPTLLDLLPRIGLLSESAVGHLDKIKLAVLVLSNLLLTVIVSLLTPPKAGGVPAADVG